LGEERDVTDALTCFVIVRLGKRCVEKARVHRDGLGKLVMLFVKLMENVTAASANQQSPYVDQLLATRVCFERADGKLTLKLYLDLRMG